MNSYTYQIGFSAATIPPVEIAIVEVSMAQVFSYIDVHEHFVETLSEWMRETSEGQQLCSEIDGPVSVGAILIALDSFTRTSLEHWMSQAGMSGFEVTVSEAVFDLDELIAE